MFAQELQDQNVKIASLESLISSQQAVIAEQGQKMGEFLQVRQQQQETGGGGGCGQKSQRSEEATTCGKKRPADKEEEEEGTDKTRRKRTKI